MKASANIIFLCFLFILAFPDIQLGQKSQDDTPRKIGGVDIEQYKGDKNFNYDIKPKRENTLFLKFIDFLDRIFSSKVAGYTWRYGKWVLAAFIIYIFLRLILQMNFKGLFRKNVESANSIPFTLTEEILEVDLEKLLQNALDNNQYRMAVRLLYLIYLRFLINKGLITWVPGKTSEEYLQELNSQEHKNTFRQLSNIFNYIWYGEIDLNSKQYLKIRDVFNNLTKYPEYAR